MNPYLKLTSHLRPKPNPKMAFHHIRTSLWSPKGLMVLTKVDVYTRKGSKKVSKPRFIHKHASSYSFPLTSKTFTIFFVYTLFFGFYIF